MYRALQYKVVALWAVRPYNHQDRCDRTSALLLLTSLQGEFFSRYKSIYLSIHIYKLNSSEFNFISILQNKKQITYFQCIFSTKLTLSQLNVL